MISRIFIFIIVFILFENVYAKHDGNNLKIEEKHPDDKVQQEQTTKIEITNDTTETAVKIKDEPKNGKRIINLKEISEKLDNLTSLVEENQGQIRSLSCWAKFVKNVKNIENKIYWISNSSSVHNYKLEGGWTFGNYNRRSVILTIFRCNKRIPN